MENYNKKKAILLSLLKWLETEFFGIFVFLFFIAVAVPFGRLANIIFGFTGLFTIVCVMGDFGFKQGEIARQKAVLRDAKVSKNFGLAMGFAASVPCFITAVLLVLSKYGIIFNFMPAYKLINACFYPFFDWTAHTANAAAMPTYALIEAFAFPLLYPLSTFFAFRISFLQIDVKSKVMYKNK